MGRKKPWKNQRKKLKQQQESQGSGESGEGGRQQQRRHRDNGGNNTSNNNRSDDKFGGEDFILKTVEAGNFKMEAYYAAQGMHHVSFAHNNNNKDKTPQLPSSSSSSSSPSSFQPLHSVQTLEEWNKERLDWRAAMGRVLPASFRFCSIVPTTVQIAMERQFMELLHQARQWKPPPPDEESNNKNDDDIPDTQTARVTPTSTVEDEEKEEMWQPLLPHETRWHSIPFGSPFAYQFETLDRGRMRKHPALKPLHEWLVQMTECGRVTRQETVSMIPPIVLLRYAAKMAAVAGATASQEETTTPTTSTTATTSTTRQEGSTSRKNNGGLAILDMCAAPGSKTSQLLEGMASLATLSSSTSSLSNDNSHGGDDDDGEGLLLHSNSGILVANDVNPQRANMLTHQIKRVLHHYPVAVVTAAPAQYLSLDDAPAAAADDDNDRATVAANDNDDGTPMTTQSNRATRRRRRHTRRTQFNLILADVPCSGDGTTRKNINVWTNWSQLGALALHKLQVDIAWHGVAHLLQIGGYLCYSTCSMNPIENEAVIAELLRRSQGQLELVDCRHNVFGTAPSSSLSLLPQRTTRKVNDNNKQNDDDDDNMEPSVLFQTRPGWSTWKVFCEPTSRKELKNRDNKHKPYMQQKRQEYARQQEQQEEDDDRNFNKSNNNKTIPGDGQEHARAVATAAQKFEPTSMDSMYLQQLATQEAGLELYENIEQVNDDKAAVAAAGLQQKQQTKSKNSKIVPSCFPPSTDKERRVLERCIRCLPHDNNTGGFFVALLHKTGPIGSTDRRKLKQDDDDDDDHETAEDLGGGTSLKRAREQQEQQVQVDAIKDDNDNDDDPEDGSNSSAKRQRSDESNENASAITRTKEEGDEKEKQPSLRQSFLPKTAAASGGRSKQGRSSQQQHQQVFVPVKDEILDPLIEYYGLGGPNFRKDVLWHVPIAIPK